MTGIKATPYSLGYVVSTDVTGSGIQLSDMINKVAHEKKVNNMK